MSEWKTIDSAPMDGTNILVIDMNAEFPEAGIATYAKRWWACKDFEVSEFEEKEFPEGGNVLDFIGFYKPTHWMPLPQPPKVD